MHSLGQGWITGSGGVTKHADLIESLGGAGSPDPRLRKSTSKEQLNNFWSDAAFLVAFV
jgi:hypothetical protein